MEKRETVSSSKRNIQPRQDEGVSDITAYCTTWDYLHRQIKISHATWRAPEKRVVIYLLSRLIRPCPQDLCVVGSIYIATRSDNDRGSATQEVGVL